MSIGSRIKELRKKRGLNQTELGEIIKLTYSAISSIESDRSSPSAEATIKLSEFFGVSADYLLTGKESTNEISPTEREIIEILRRDDDLTEAIKEAAGIKKKVINYLRNYRLHVAMGETNNVLAH